ncbi:MAG TPA: flagellar basal body rod C-terminal domain-containing protein [Aliidongia sp.]|uniref:flagellar basal body rod C-terminal domain-containing protein n=1 Tax=Aliidongia sp. TaxID=1914230 RepID=UPI002DDCE078|nr:flagellar basal body rod C-terminal domain-containing protein [Aliidongia sp.]HEV2675015.1 flagellar basal body rod C-terminal domain-containing protein [Aliidongia sp.]
MVDSLAGAASNALTGIEQAQNRIATAASNIASTGAAPSGSVTAPPLTGGQFGTAAGQVQQALQGAGGDLSTNLIDVATAKISYEANAKVLKTVDKLAKDTIDIVT